MFLDDVCHQITQTWRCVSGASKVFGRHARNATGESQTRVMLESKQVPAECLSTRRIAAHHVGPKKTKASAHGNAINFCGVALPNIFRSTTTDRRRELLLSSSVGALRKRFGERSSSKLPAPSIDVMWWLPDRTQSLESVRHRFTTSLRRNAH